MKARTGEGDEPGDCIFVPATGTAPGMPVEPEAVEVFGASTGLACTNASLPPISSDRRHLQR
jgi:hypothetical protein